MTFSLSGKTIVAAGVAGYGGYKLFMHKKRKDDFDRIQTSLSLSTTSIAMGRASLAPTADYSYPDELKDNGEPENRVCKTTPWKVTAFHSSTKSPSHYLYKSLRSAYNYSGSGFVNGLYKPSESMAFSMTAPESYERSGWYLSAGQQPYIQINRLGEVGLNIFWQYVEHYRKRPRPWKSHRSYYNYHHVGTRFMTIPATHKSYDTSAYDELVHEFKLLGDMVNYIDIKEKPIYIMSSSPLKFEGLSWGGDAVYRFIRDVEQHIFQPINLAGAFNVYKVPVTHCKVYIKSDKDNMIWFFVNNLE